MTSKTVYPNTYNSTTGGKFQPFKNLSNVHTKKTTTYASTELIHGKKDPFNRPGTVTVSNFKCGLPTGSLVTKVTVYYAHSKVAYNGKVCNIPAPEISLMNDTKVIKYNKTGKATTKTGKAPTTNIVTGSVSFSSGWDWSLFNSTKFGVRINYPTNANNEEGYMRLYYVYVVLEYKAPSYSLKCTGSEGNTGYNGDDYTVQLDLSNINGTRYATTVILTAPAGFTYEDATGNGTIEKVQNQVYRWTPKMINGTMSIALRFSVNVTFPLGAESYTGEFVAKEQLLGKGSRYNAVITPRPASIDIDPEEQTWHDSDTDTSGTVQPDTPADYIVPIKLTDEQLTLNVPYPPDMEIADNYSLRLHTDAPIYLQCYYYYRSQKITVYDGELNGTKEYSSTAAPDGDLTLKCSSTIQQRVNVNLTVGYLWFDEDEEGGYYRDTQTFSYSIDFVMTEEQKESLSIPNIALMTLNPEELNRLGHTTPYRLQSEVKKVTTDTTVHDWGKNFRIGVFNNPITANQSIIEIPAEDENDPPTELIIDSTDYDNLTVTEIFNNAEYWSGALTTPNEYENLECKFVYNENYPLYILVTGDYPESSTYNTNTVKFIEPCIIEDSYYDGRESNGTYPVPIENTKNGDGDFAELNINSLGTASPVIYYDLPFDEDYGTNENIAIRGIEVSGVIEQNTDDIHMYAKLKAPGGESRVRSLNLDALDTDVNSDNRFVLGGMGDLWGLSTLDIKNLEDWEIEFLADNTINSETGTINYHDITLTLYITDRDTQKIQCSIDGEGLSYYGAFITDVDIPAGLSTDVNYLTIDGTDTNDPYSQNIKEKEITLHLDIGDGCDLQSSTLELRNLTRLIQNKRDKYNRPIPKRIEFSHYPDIYWEYILEDSFDNPIEINTYEVKIKLTIPAGTAYKNQATSTNKSGYVNGLANVNPVIVIKPTDTLMTITETITDQNFHLGYDGDLTDKVIVIDCEDRIVWLKTDEDDEDGENITYSVDFNADWFSIIEEYEFETTGCVIKDVSYIERW